MALFQLIYVSTMLKLGVDAFPAILESSVRNNRNNDVTGMLLYADGGVLQVIEGEKDKVLETFRIVQRDPRHCGILVLMEEDIPERQFSSWSMGFKHLTEAELNECPTGSDVFQGHHDQIDALVLKGYARTILKSFSTNRLDRLKTDSLI